MVRGGCSGVVLALVVALTAGCGGLRHPAAARDPAASDAPLMPRRQNTVDPTIFAPKRVPRHGSGPADPAAIRVIDGWLRALRAGDIPRAASYFAIPSRFQNGTPVLTLDSRTEVLAVNVSFPCGAVATRFSRAGAFTLVRFRLTPRRNGDCGGDAGAETGAAIRVAGGRIQEWYRLYDPDEPKPGPAEIDPGNEAL
jgi:hypothetical protein